MIVPVWSAMVSGIRSGFAERGLELAQCEKAGGRISLETIEELGAATPAVLVSVLRLRDLTLLGRLGAQYHLDCAAYCVAGALAEESEDERAARMVELLIGSERGILVSGRNWGRADCRAIAPETLDAVNLWTGTVDQQGLALWAVSWSQRIDTNPRLSAS